MVLCEIFLHLRINWSMATSDKIIAPFIKTIFAKEMYNNVVRVGARNWKGSSGTVADTNWTSKNFMCSTRTLEVMFIMKVFQFKLCSRTYPQKNWWKSERDVLFIYIFHKRRYNFVTRIVPSNNYFTFHCKTFSFFGCSKIKIVWKRVSFFSAIHRDFFFIVLLRISIILRRFLPVP